ncbi:nucleotidyltransferase domain-containing protein [Verrucomicrobiota bacterium]
MAASMLDLRQAETQLAEAQSVARRFASEVREHFAKRLRGVRLYGSAARGDWTAESDIDILVLLDRLSGADEEWIVNRAVALGLLGSGLLVQPIFMTQSHFDHLRQRERRFALEVEREGIEL